MRTVVTRETEWDEHEIAKMQALAIYEADVCDCGFHHSVADQDPELKLTVRRCPVCAGIAQTMRQVAAQDEKTVAALGRDPAPEVPRPEDGRKFGLTPNMSPEFARLLALAEAQTSDKASTA